MKKLLLIVCIAVFGNINAQDIQILDSLNKVVNGDTLSISGVIPGNDPNYRIDFKYIQVKNNSSTTADIYVNRIELDSIQAGSADLLCWGGLCDNAELAGTNPMRTSSQYETMAPGDSILGGGLGFAAYYQPNGNSGHTYHMYEFVDKDGILASANFVIKFTAQKSTGINEKLTSLGISISPNPAVSFFKLKYDLKRDFAQKEVEVLDLVGKVVMNHRIENFKGSETLQLSTLKPGVYFVRIKADGQYTASQKLVVK